MPQYLQSEAYGGGGAYISVMDNFPEDQLSASRTFLFRNCTFKNNTAHTKKYEFVYILRSGYGRGGGLYVYVSNGLKHVHVSFIDCKFISNHAFIGGGLSVNIQSKNGRKTQNVTVEIIDTFFLWNGYGGSTDNHTGLGGGLHISFSNIVGGITSYTHYRIQNVNLSNNHAELGGAVFYHSYRGREETFNLVNSILFDDCKFNRNRAHIGSAIAMTPYVFRKLSNGFIVVPKFLNCNFSRNSVFVKRSLDTYKQRITGIGTIYTSFYDIQFEGNNTFHSNYGTAIHAVNGIVNLTSSHASFINNTDINGGALGLIGASIVIFGPKSYNFSNNTALYQGGAVYVSMIDSTDFINSRNLFLSVP